MHEILYRVLILVWFLAYMAAIYLVLHMVVARFSRNPHGAVLWFFNVVTAPLTWPVRAVLPPQAPEGRVRLVALGMYVALWIGARWVLSGMGGPRLG